MGTLKELYVGIICEINSLEGGLLRSDWTQSDNFNWDISCTNWKRFSTVICLCWLYLAIDLLNTLLTTRCHKRCFVCQLLITVASSNAVLECKLRFFKMVKTNLVRPLEAIKSILQIVTSLEDFEAKIGRDSDRLWWSLRSAGRGLAEVEKVGYTVTVTFLQPLHLL